MSQVDVPKEQDLSIETPPLSHLGHPMHASHDPEPRRATFSGAWSRNEIQMQNMARTPRSRLLLNLILLRFDTEKFHLDT